MEWDDNIGEEELRRRVYGAEQADSAMFVLQKLLPMIEARAILAFREMDPTNHKNDNVFDQMAMIAINLKLRVIEELKSELVQIINAGKDAMDKLREITDGGKGNGQRR